MQRHHRLLQQRPGAAATALGPVSLRAPLSFSARRCQPRQPRHVGVAASPIETDAACRVAGTPASVADYLSRVDETWPEWYPRLVSAKRADSGSNSRSAPPRFEVIVRAAGGGGGLIPALDLPVTVQLLERSSKRVAFAASSPLHEVREQYVLMPCPGDPSGRHTTIRHVSEVRLRGAWAGALAAPVVGGIMRSAPKEALARLEAALRVEEQRRQQRGAKGGRGGKAAADGGGSSNGSFWKGLFGNGRASSPSSSSSSTTTTNSNNSDDPHGLYAALGLEPRALTGGDSAAAEALVKAAYRQRAKLLHPDANLGAGAADVERLEVEFARVQRAYSVLRDGEARRRYDEGRWRPEDDEE
jgi:hypothetical protein